jgi:hypothetical protein
VKAVSRIAAGAFSVAAIGGSLMLAPTARLTWTAASTKPDRPGRTVEGIMGE